ncbi:MAG: MarR family transcriptional regulator [Gemmatimonadaceae bacterium]
MTLNGREASRRAELERDFVAAICPLREKLRRRYDDELTSFGISRSLASALVSIGTIGGIRQRDLAERLDIEGPSVVRLIDQLESSDLVVRRTDPDDQRARTLHLTDAGTALLLRVTPIIQEVRTQLLADVATEDLESCLRTFERFFAACEKTVLSR